MKLYINTNNGGLSCHSSVCVTMAIYSECTTHIHSKLMFLYASKTFLSLLIFSPCVKGSYLGVPGLAQPAQTWLCAEISLQEQHVLCPKDSLHSHNVLQCLTLFALVARVVISTKGRLFLFLKKISVLKQAFSSQTICQSA